MHSPNHLRSPDTGSTNALGGTRSADTASDNNTEDPGDSNETEEPQLEFEKFVTLANKAKIIKRLRTRATFLKTTAILILLLIIALLGGGGYVVYEADRFVSDNLAPPSLDPLTRRLEEFKPQIASLKTEIGSLGEAIAGAQFDPKFGAPPPPVDDQKLRNATVEKATLEAQQSSIRRKIDDAQFQAEELRTRENNLRRDLLSVESDISNLEDQRSRSGRDLERAQASQNNASEPSPTSSEDKISSLEREISLSERDLATSENVRTQILNKIDQAEKQRKNQESSLSALRTEHEGLSIKLAEIDQIIVTETARIQEIRKFNKEEKEAQTWFATELAEMKSVVNDVSTRANVAATAISGLVGQTETLESKFDEKLDERVTSRTISTMTARITIVFILIFLTQIFVNLYRYNMRLAFFYDGRADALELYQSGTQSLFESLFESLSPDRLDFGKAPQSPAQHAVELAKALVEGGKRASSK